MRQEIETGLPSLGQPFSWAVPAGRMIYTSHGPVTGEGRILQGDIAAQAELTLTNLRRALEAGGASMDGVVQVQLFLLDSAEIEAVDAVYARHFRPPYPNRSTIIVAGLVAPGMRLELLAVAELPDRSIGV